MVITSNLLMRDTYGNATQKAEQNCIPQCHPKLVITVITYGEALVSTLLKTACPDVCAPVLAHCSCIVTLFNCASYFWQISYSSCNSRKNPVAPNVFKKVITSLVELVSLPQHLNFKRILVDQPIQSSKTSASSHSCQTTFGVTHGCTCATPHLAWTHQLN